MLINTMLDFKAYFLGLARRDRIKTLLELHEWVAEQKGSAALDALMMRLITLYDTRVPDEELAADRVWKDLEALSTTTLYTDMLATIKTS
jgi:hypothetical protein